MISNRHLALRKLVKQYPKQVFQVGYQYRYSPLYFKVKEMIQSQDILVRFPKLIVAGTGMEIGVDQCQIQVWSVKLIGACTRNILVD
jgi:hypothetical protein